MKNKKYVIAAFSSFLLGFAPIAFADSITFVPTSPDLYNGSNDAVLTSVNSANTAWYPYLNSGGHTNCNAGCATANDTSVTYSSIFSFTMASDLGAPGTINFVEVNYTDPQYVSQCHNGTYTTCVASTAFIQEVDYVLSAPVPPNGIDVAIGVATSSFAHTYGFSLDDATVWMWDNLGQPILGSGIGTLVVMKWYWLGFIAFGIVILFAFYYFRFYKR